MRTWLGQPRYLSIVSSGSAIALFGGFGSPVCNLVRRFIADSNSQSGEFLLRCGRESTLAGMALNFRKPRAAEIVQCLVRGAIFGVIVGVLLAAIATGYDWHLNPSGIFHDAAGNHWDIIFDTAISWFLPVAPVVAIFAALAFLLFRPK